MQAPRRSAAKAGTPTRTRFRRWTSARGWAAFSLLVFGVAAVWLYAATKPPPLPSYAEAQALHTPSHFELQDRHGNTLEHVRIDFTAYRLAWQHLPAMGDALPAAVVQAEDRRFWRHAGVDWRAFGGAIVNRLRGQPLRGASTISMQTASLLLSAEHLEETRRGRRSLRAKILQIRAAYALEQRWKKTQILETYLNLVSFRGEAQGAPAASQRLFGTTPALLSGTQAALMAALLPRPNAPLTEVARRACAQHAIRGTVQEADQKAHRAQQCATIQSAAQDLAASLATSSTVNAEQRDQTGAAHLARNLAKNLARQPAGRPSEPTAPMVITSTLDRRIQSLAVDAVATQLAALADRNVRDGAAIVLDNATGEVLAYVGSAGPESRAHYVDGAPALRQAGSTLKPFLYALALERGYLTAASLLDDSPVALETGAGQYIPQNYDHVYRGPVSVRTALSGSLNVPAVRTAALVGVEQFREQLAVLGYRTGLVEDGAYYGYALALGAPEVTLLEQTNAYRTLANGGRWTPIRTDARLPIDTRSSQQVIDPGAAWVIADVLSDNAARAASFGFTSPLATPFWSAVKTGTSKFMRDNWALGFSSRYTVGVWVGNFEGDAMGSSAGNSSHQGGDVSGVTGAAPAWLSIMRELHAQTPSEQPAPPTGIKQRDIAYADAIEPARREWFLRRYAVPSSAIERAIIIARPRLLTPEDGLIAAIDPDIPLAHQHMVLRASGLNGPGSPGGPGGPGRDELDGTQTAYFEMNGTRLGSASEPRRWAPRPGRHKLVLRAADGRTLDTAHFEVRMPPVPAEPTLPSVPRRPGHPGQPGSGGSAASAQPVAG